MKTFTLTNKAKEDFKDIARYTENRWGKAQRNLTIKQCDDMFHFLAETPLAGKACDHIKQGYYQFPQGSHIIFYRKTEGDNIEIIRILHKSMNVPSRLPSSVMPR
jgi:toxin ParE1/3/4